MKRFFTLCMALLFAGSAFAQEVKQEEKKGPEFKFGVWANAFAGNEETAKKDEAKDYSNIRIRPMVTYTNNNISVVTRFEIDQYFGGKYSATGNDTSYADPDGDEKTVEVKWAYINAKDMIVPGLSLTAGLAPYVYSVGFNNDMPLFNFVYDAGLVKVDLAYIKFVEGNTTDAAAATATNEAGKKAVDDAQAGAVKLPISLGDITITPSYLYFAGEKKVTGTTGSALGYSQKITMPALGVKAKFGALSFDGDFQYISGERKLNADDSKIDITAYAAYANAGFKASDSFKINLFGLYSTGEDDKADEITSFHTACLDEVEVGPMFIINDNGYINQVGVSNEFDKATEGLIMYGLSAELKMDKITALAQIAYATTASDKQVKDTAIGTEIDLRLSYEIAPKSYLWAEGAYLMAGKYVETAYTSGAEKGDDAMYYAAGIMTSF